MPKQSHWDNDKLLSGVKWENHLTVFAFSSCEVDKQALRFSIQLPYKGWQRIAGQTRPAYDIVRSCPSHARAPFHALPSDSLPSQGRRRAPTPNRTGHFFPQRSLSRPLGPPPACALSYHFFEGNPTYIIG